MTNNYKTLQSLILASEGKTLEDELGFGCRVKIKRLNNRQALMVSKKISSHGNCAVVLEGASQATPGMRLLEEDEILGKDIGLERVLRSLEKKEPFTFYVGSDGKLFDGDTDEVVLHWSLDKPLHLQSEEVFTKLIELLK